MHPHTYLHSKQTETKKKKEKESKMEDKRGDNYILYIMKAASNTIKSKRMHNQIASVKKIKIHEKCYH